VGAEELRVHHWLGDVEEQLHLGPLFVRCETVNGLLEECAIVVILKTVWDQQLS
jgi:hypothetical protein